MAQVVLLTTGGTIASRMDHERGYVASSVGPEELLGTLRHLPAGAEVRVEEFCNVGSYLIDLETAHRLCLRAAQVLGEPEVSGVVVTHGTDTMEESAYMADLFVGSDKPVVFTGAQRNADEPDTDGPRNLADAVRIAASPLARGLGAVIAFEQEFHAARDATKTHAYRVGTFASAEHGKLGEVDGDRVIVHRRPALRRTLHAPRIDARVDLVKMVMGADGRFVRCAVEGGAKGVVLEAFGRGNATLDVVRAVREATGSGVRVIVSSRSPMGRVMPVYGNGGGKDLAAAGAVFAGDLSGPKARVLLAVLLGMGLDDGEMREAIEALAG